MITPTRTHSRLLLQKDLPNRLPRWIGCCALLLALFLTNPLSAQTIVGQPTDQSVFLGTPTSFSVIANGATHYQWRLNGKNIPGATTATINIPVTTLENGGSYSVVVANQTNAIISQRALLCFNDFPIAPSADQFKDRFPLFPSQGGTIATTNLSSTAEADEPNHAQRAAEASVWFEWTASDTGIATFRTSGSTIDTIIAIYRGAELTNLTEVISDDDRADYYTSQVQFNVTAGETFQVAVDGFAGDSGKFILDWNLEICGEGTPTNQRTESNLATFSSTIDLTSAPANRQEGEDGGEPFQTFQLLAATGRGHEVIIHFDAALDTNTVGTNSFQLFHEFGETIIEEASVEFPPSIVVLLLNEETPLPDNVQVFVQAFNLIDQDGNTLDVANSQSEFVTPSFDVLETVAGTSAQLNVECEPSRLLQVDWFFNGNPLPSNNTPSFLINNLQLEDQGLYTAVCFTPTGTLWADFLVLVQDSPLFIARQPASQFVHFGSEARFEVAAIGSPPIKYQWHWNGLAIIGATSSVYTVSSAQFANEGSYSVTIQNDVTTITSDSARLQICESIPEFILQPTNRTVTPNEAVTLTAQVSDGGATYQWYLNDQAIIGANASTYTIPNTQRQHVGRYYALANNMFGRTALSREVVIEIGFDPNVQTQNKVRFDLDHSLAPLALNSADGFGGGAFSSEGPSYRVGIGSTLSHIFNNTGASTQDPETNHCARVANASRWLYFETTNSGTLRLDTARSSIPTVLAVYERAPLLFGGGVASLVSCAVTNAANGTNAVLEFPVTTDGLYAVAMDGVDYAEGIIQLNWIFCPTPTSGPIGPKTNIVEVGESLALCKRLDTSSHPESTYQWRKNGIAIPGATDSILFLRSIENCSSPGTYTLEISNSSGTETTTDYVVVRPRLSILMEPPRVVVESGHALTLQRAVSLKSPITWATVATKPSGICSFIYTIPTSPPGGTNGIFRARIELVEP